MKRIIYGIIFFVFIVSSLPVTASAATSSKTNGKVLIDSGRSITHDRRVSLSFTPPAGAEAMMVSRSGDFHNASWETVKKKKTWYLEYGIGPQTVFVKFRYKSGTITDTIRDTITLQPATASAKVTLKDDTVDTRYITVSSTLSNGIESYRYGVKKDLSSEPFISIKNSQRLEIIIPAGDGKKTIYIDFKDASGKVIQKTISLNYTKSGRELAEGTVVYGQDKKYYYYGYDGRLHLFPNEQVLRSWYTTDVTTTPVSKSKIEQYAQGSAMCVRSGTHLVRFAGSSQVYIPDAGCVLQPLRSVVEGHILYGSSWRTRIIELPSTYLLHYSVERPNAADKTEKIKDQDRDGVGDDVERQYGTSDRRDDSDGDGLSDFEEIEYWFSDPAMADSDSDGHTDAQEILNGYSPIGADRLTHVPEDTYTYPVGTVVRPKTTKPTKNSKMYYVRSADQVSSLGTKTNSKPFTIHHLQVRFVVDPPLFMTLPKVKGAVSTKRDASIIEPSVLQNGELKQL